MNESLTNTRPPRSALLVFKLTLFLFVACVGCNLKSDTQLKNVFDAHTSDFVRLATMSMLDRNVGRLQVKAVRPNEINIPEKRWQEYQKLFHNLGITQGMEHPYDRPGVVFFYTECQGSAITRDCKGYAYSEESLTPVRNSLDSLAPGIAFKPLSQNWYLFRDGG
jgi:hypothetical protein